MNVQSYNFDNYQLVNITLQAVQPRWYFPDLPNLRTVRTFAISVYNSLSIVTDQNRVPSATNLDMEKAYLTLNIGGDEKYKQLDLMYFSALSNVAQYNYALGYFQIDGAIIDFSKSYIEYPIGYTSVTPYPYSFSFGIFYSYLSPAEMQVVSKGRFVK